MTPHEPFSRYGAIVGEDVAVLESCLALCVPPKPHVGTPVIDVLEIGMHDGGTARGIERFLAERGAFTAYTGIDPDDGMTRPRYVPPKGRVIVGDSAEVYGQAEPLCAEGFDLVWIDGCHCFNHVVLDTLHFAPKVRVGGFLCYHDANPVGQGRFHQYHGPDTADFGLSIASALIALRFPWPGWGMYRFACPDDRDDCGTAAFRRTA